MLLEITNTRSPVEDLSFLLHKHPDRFQSFDLSFGKAHVFYPEMSPARCTAALLLDVDPIHLVRGRKGPSGEGGSMDQYVNDRPYVASSFMSVAISQVFGSALAGKCKDRPEAVERVLPLEARLSVVPCRGGEAFLRSLFEPLGYEVEASRHPLDERFPEWGEGPYFTVGLKAAVRLQDLLSHLYVLVPVLDDQKHYWIGQDEVEKLLRHGEGWLAAHPEKERITARYLGHWGSLTRSALARLLEEDEASEEEEEKAAEAKAAEEEKVERPLRLNEQRLGAVLAAIRASDARRVVDLGCGEGRLLSALLEDRAFTEIVGMDVSHRALEIAASRLRLDRMPEQKRARIRLLQGALTYRDKCLAGFDAAAVVEVVEHLDKHRLSAFERVLFGQQKPLTIVLTTPNVEYNARFEDLPAGKLRHRDHRFEWTRAEFRAWAEGVSSRYGYRVRFLPVGDEDPALGPPCQMAVFGRNP
ncbi:MAG: 3' terminal RNA ribose 2'-O-methyltransferase Hen1 [Planctomycetota bacterium]